MDASGEKLSWRHDDLFLRRPLVCWTPLRTSQDLTRGDTGPKEVLS